MYFAFYENEIESNDSALITDIKEDTNKNCLEVTAYHWALGYVKYYFYNNDASNLTEYYQCKISNIKLFSKPYIFKLLKTMEL